MTTKIPLFRCDSAGIWGLACDSEPMPADKMVAVRFVEPWRRGTHASAPFRGRWTHGYFCLSCWEAAHPEDASDPDHGYLEEVEELDP